MRTIAVSLVVLASPLTPALAPAAADAPAAVARPLPVTAATPPKALENRVFFTGPLEWYYQASSSFGSLSKRGHDATDFGGTVTSVTGCFYNESAFSRQFEATMSVRQGGVTLQSIDFARAFPGQQVQCHSLSGFDVAVEPGDFEIVVAYDRGDADNFWLGLPATTLGQTFDVQVGSQRPPTVTGPSGPQTVKGVGIRYAITTNDAPAPPPSISLVETGALIVPGYVVDVETAGGETTFFAVRNTSGSTRNVVAEYHGARVEDEPLRTDAATLGPRETWTANVAADVEGLPVVDGAARGVLLLRRPGGDAAALVGDTFRVDGANDFASGGRMVGPGDFCGRVEARFVDIGAGAELRVLLDQPPAEGEPAFSYVVVDEAGATVAAGEMPSTDHLLVLDAADLAGATRFGTVVFDFASSKAGWVGGRFSAFGRFSVEVPGACRD